MDQALGTEQSVNWYMLLLYCCNLYVFLSLETCQWQSSRLALTGFSLLTRISIILCFKCSQTLSYDLTRCVGLAHRQLFQLLYSRISWIVKILKNHWSCKCWTCKKYVIPKSLHGPARTAQQPGDISKAHAPGWQRMPHSISCSGCFCKDERTISLSKYMSTGNHCNVGHEPWELLVSWLILASSSWQQSESQQHWTPHSLFCSICGNIKAISDGKWY